ncbi:MAG: recombinase family protein [Pseudomonadota bacterium]
MAEKTAVIYARVSTVRQAEEELPIASQLDQCRAKVEALGARVVREFVDEGLSGRGDNRPEFQAAISYCEAFAPDYLITWSTSRFARNKLDAAMYKMRLARAGVDLAYVTLTIDRKTDGGFLTEGILELFDEYFSRQVSADTKRSMIKNAREGFWNGGVPPYGFQVLPAPENPRRKRLSPNPAEVDTVRRMFDLRLEGYGGKTIAFLLNEEGCSNRGKRWNKSAVSALLHNEAVIGHTVFGKKDRTLGRMRPREDWIVVESHEAIVPIEKWTAVQGIMQDPLEGLAGGTQRSQFIFTGILRCGICGASMQTESAKGRSRRYHYYNCRTYQKHSGCANRRLPAAEVDAWLLDEILGKILNEANLRQTVEEIKAECGQWATDQRRRRQAVARELEDTTKKVRKLYEIMEEFGKDTPNLGDLTARLREHNASIKRLEGKLVAIDAEQAPQIEVDQADIRELAEAVATIIKTTENPKKLRQFFSSFIEGIHIGNDAVRIEYNPEAIINRPERAVHSEAIWLPGTGSNRRPSD